MGERRTIALVLLACLLQLFMSSCAHVELATASSAQSQLAIGQTPSAKGDVESLGHFATKTLYRPQQATANYAPPPPGYEPVFTQLVARHGARGLSGPGADLLAYNLFLEARARGALTPLGERFGPDVLQMMRTNALLGYSPDTAKSARVPGYGNLSARGVDEHRALAQRMLARLPSLFAAPAGPTNALPNAARANGARLIVQTSGVDRARDSARNFVEALVNAAPQVSVEADAVSPVAAASPAANNAAVHTLSGSGVQRSLLYFHRLSVAQDGVAGTRPEALATLEASLRYQKYLAEASLRARIDAYFQEPQVRIAARSTLVRLFSNDFVDRLERGEVRVHRDGEHVFVSDDGKLTRTVRARPTEKNASLTIIDAAIAVYDLYAIAPGLREELNRDFRDYITPEAVAVFAFLSDAEDFYEKGPGILEDNPVTYALAGELVADMFAHANAVARGEASHVATLRFTHAEIISPLVSALALPAFFAPERSAMSFRHASNPWRGETVIPMSSNLQWDVYRNARGHAIVRMLFNERETPFKRECDAARVAPTAAAAANFYDLSALTRCYLETSGQLPYPSFPRRRESMVDEESSSK